MSTMSIIRDSRPICNKPTSRPRNARVAFSLLVLIFLGTSAFAYILVPTQDHIAESPPRAYCVTATVVQPAGSVTSPASPASPGSASDAATLEKTILSDANLIRASQLISLEKEQHEEQHQTPSSEISGQSLEKLRRQLRVATTTKTPAGQVEISITYSGRGDPRQACRLVNALAEQAARQNTAQRRAAAGAEHQNAKKAAEQAHRELIKTKADYDAFLDQHFTSKLSSTPPSTIPPAPLPPGTQLNLPTPGLHFPRSDWAEAPESPTLNNPRWAALNKKLSRLTNRRDELLRRMTHAHPEVQNLDLEIEDLQRLISSVPRELPRPGRDSLPPIAPMPPDPTDDLLAPGGEGRAMGILADEPVQPSVPRQDIPHSRKRPNTSDFATPSELHPRREKVFRQKQKALDLAQQKYNRLTNLERAAWERFSNVQPAEVIPAAGAEISPEISPDSVSARSLRHILASLIIGLCGTVGIGMFSAGVSSPPSFANAAEVRNALKVPVVGTMPAADLPGADAEGLGRRRKNRLALAASGMIFLIVAVAMIITSFVIS